MGNFSRNTFDRLQHYVGVRLQQGVPLIDADWNEQEDIRKYELQAFLKWFAGNGVPSGNDGFRILAAPGTTNNFDIKGGNGTAEGAGRCLVEGLDVMLESTMRYTSQPLYNNGTLAASWGGGGHCPAHHPCRRPHGYCLSRCLGAGGGQHRGQQPDQSGHRHRVLRAAQARVGSARGPGRHGSACSCCRSCSLRPLARIKRPAGSAAILTEQIEDLRSVGINLADLAAEIIDARGIKGNVGNRLDESLTKGGQLRFNVVGNDQVQATAAINESKILFSATGHDHSGGAAGNTIGASGLEDNAVTTNKLADLSVTSGKLVNDSVITAKIHDGSVTTAKIADDTVNHAKLDLTAVNNGSVVDLAPDGTSIQLVQANVSWINIKRLWT